MLKRGMKLAVLFLLANSLYNIALSDGIELGRRMARERISENHIENVMHLDQCRTAFRFIDAELANLKYEVGR